jgi:hypothetical protein
MIPNVVELTALSRESLLGKLYELSGELFTYSNELSIENAVRDFRRWNIGTTDPSESILEDVRYLTNPEGTVAKGLIRSSYGGAENDYFESLGIFLPQPVGQLKEGYFQVNAIRDIRHVKYGSDGRRVLFGDLGQFNSIDFLDSNYRYLAD